MNHTFCIVGSLNLYRNYSQGNASSHNLARARPGNVRVNQWLFKFKLTTSTQVQRWLCHTLVGRWRSCALPAVWALTTSRC